MSEPPPRRTLSLKSSRPVAEPAPKVWQWKCKPCGAVVEISPELADDDAVRCPACSARLGKAGQFRADPPDMKVRARRAEAKPEPVAPPPSSGPTVVVVQRRRITPR